MPTKCNLCGSCAINPGHHGRPPFAAGVDHHLCDVCFWRTRAEGGGCVRCVGEAAFDVKMTDDGVEISISTPRIRSDRINLRLTHEGMVVEAFENDEITGALCREWGDLEYYHILGHRRAGEEARKHATG